MTDIITIPAGVIQPRELLMWLRRERDNTREIARDYENQGDDYDAARWNGYTEAIDAVIQHVSYG